jgi:hypothetical protein
VRDIGKKRENRIQEKHCKREAKKSNKVRIEKCSYDFAIKVI